ncbi:flagellar basal body-associated FliL family protein [Stakelama marina]|uniref:Flagellar protein FliL n=1 Tax=Stakelama marina TaxID=2826939 RepID=A0A8T4ILU6_9SPHN|nr:flagellar basal body-associated FliL family protein [Stakelama marina]MBR0553136.1 flagellar basal body-associated FliL family protein [Stakelama marina]
MADSDNAKDTAEPKKKKKGLKMIGLIAGVLVLAGGGAGAGIYAAQSGMLSAAPHAAVPDTPQLVPKSEEKRASAGGEGEAGGEGGGEGTGHGMATPAGSGGDRYASNYYAMDKEFTSNLQDSVHFIQVGVAISTPYDDRVIDNLKTHEIAVRSAILMSLGQTSEDQVFTVEGKRQLQQRLKKAINDTLKEKEGFGGVSNVYFTNFVVQ